MQAMRTKVTIQNELGLHARPAMAFVDHASQFASTIQIIKEGQTVDGKSIMQIMMLAATKGTELEITAEGPDAEQAIASLEKLVNDKFGED
ncbi:MAG: HPr family phosphocarrier protein [Planctomycetota bacterium]